MLIITQEPWHVETAAQRLLSLAEAAREQFGEIKGGLLLLPLGEAGPKRLRPEQDVLADAGSVADGLGIHIAGAAPMIAAHSDKPQTVGFVVGADGAAALPKDHAGLPGRLQRHRLRRCPQPHIIAVTRP